MMKAVFDFFFEVYYGQEPYMVVLEMIAVFLGVLSVWLAKKEHIGVFPTGIVSTGIFVYILWVYGLLGDMLINAYYTAMSLYGWWYWARPTQEKERPISVVQRGEWPYIIWLFVCAVVFVVAVYTYFDKFHDWTAYVDTFTTAVFFVAMFLMAKKKWEHWHFWILGNLISIPLYWYKGLTFTAVQYILFTIIAVQGYQTWKNSLNKPPAPL
jgi:nicotinamide mononucleotide transporter